MLNSVSVIIPVHNRPDLLRRALRSVLAQTQPVHEIIVIDDGSDTPLQPTLTQQFPRVLCKRQAHAGVSRARNHGLQTATGDWIAFLDSDDEWRPDKLARQQQALDAHSGYQACHSDEIWIRNGVRVNAMRKHAKAGGWIFRHCLPLCAISPSAALVHRSVFDTIGLFDETLPACEDYDLWLRLTARYPILFVEQPLIVKYGGHDDQLSRRYWGMDRFRIRALQKILDDPQLGPENQQAAHTMLLKKIRVYLKGARKRNKSDEVAYYEQLYQDYANRL